ncbi:unnamed protein product [Fusarium graminearum]|nr:unnamed protein product [Fusarium graminearum]CAG1981261.1 unnamed protein product [Fusarium graminearum]VTO82135.1 unnamed protein product [Fusarium graminearum]
MRFERSDLRAMPPKPDSRFQGGKNVEERHGLDMNIVANPTKTDLIIESSIVCLPYTRTEKRDGDSRRIPGKH